MLFYDTETCGFHGLAVLMQYAEDDGPIHLHHVFKRPVRETLELIEYFINRPMVGFNLAFDHFHLCKLFTIFSRLPPTLVPEEDLRLIAINEAPARLGPCLKPASVLDLMLYSRKGPFQSLMDRKPIKIRKVPTALAPLLVKALDERVKISDIYFARKVKHEFSHWKVKDTKDANFKDLELNFAAGGGLKHLAKYVLGVKDVLLYEEMDMQPFETGWAPFCSAHCDPATGVYNGTWPSVIQHHVNYWFTSEKAQQYARDDVVHTRNLYKHFGSPACDDTDSILACMVAAVRWRGYGVDLPKMSALRDRANKKSVLVEKSPGDVKRALLPLLNDLDRRILTNRDGNISTRKQMIEIISRRDNPAGRYARLVLEARKAEKEVQLYDKILKAGRFHASFVVVGALSNRMSGSDGFNPMAINSSKEVRECFTLADGGDEEDPIILSGGDFDSFEVALAEADYNDEKLREDLLSGKKIHAIFGQMLNPGTTYEDIIASKGTSRDLYHQGKQGVFSQVYGGDDKTLVNKLGVDPDVAMTAYKSFGDRYQGVNRARQRTFNDFCSMRQPKLGGKVTWSEPKDYVESMLGFRRYFTLENQVCKALYNLAQKVPDEWKEIKIKVLRRERIQTAAGATMSALFGAAFGVQSLNMRAAANHRIQASGAGITKEVQRGVWDIQPTGIHQWLVVPFQVHDEVLCCNRRSVAAKVKEVVDSKVVSFKGLVPMIQLDWKIGMGSWAEK